MVGAVDIGGTKIAVGLVDDAGRVAARTDTPSYVGRGPADATERISQILDVQQRQAGTRIAGIGIGCTGPVDPLSGELQDVNTLPGWCGWNPVLQLSEAFGVTAAMENDADAMALGVARWGTGSGKQSLICITVGTGIGAGIVLNGQIYRGANHSHPELGHHIIEPGGPQCTCGACGCWESLAAGPALEQWFSKEATKASPGGTTAREICDRARGGDPIAMKAVMREGRYLGAGLANVISMFMPEAIVLGGSVMQSAELFLPLIHETISKNCALVPHKMCEISLASLGPDAGLIGAAQAWHNRFQNR